MGQNQRMKWFEEWFDSPYYHILYQNRNDKEAELFMDKLIEFLHPEKNALFLDLACGKGRHAFYLNKKGFYTVGIDLSAESIAYASRFENDSLQFYVQDMRRPFRINYFSHILNLFTSFGYFDSEKDNLAVMHAVHKMLKPKGLFVLDFMNVHKVVSNLVEKEIKTVAGVTFHISKQIENDFIIKHIRFSDKGENFEYQERVKVLELKDFERYLCEADLKIVNLFGNYQLAPYDESTSERLIIIAHKE